MTDVYLFGTNNVSRLLVNYLKTDDRYSILGITANKEYCTSPEFLGFPLVPFADLAPNTDSFGIINCVAYSQKLQLREAIGAQILDKNIPLISYIHRDAVVDGVELGQGCLVLNRVVIEPYSKVGRHNVFYGGNYICHNTSIGDCNWFSAGCVVAGEVQIGNRNFIGINASIRNGLTIGSTTTVGMGAVIVKDVKSDTTVFGNPAVVRNKEQI
ncbi:MAG: acetyltransferase [Candidatus Adiutrix sp.]|jgi:sugar O-acyltransferase (sialic acid O-acetyltransferase NeuD family)|nr:acetyltransferase [Candidatus Adiutrix sp.]